MSRTTLRAAQAARATLLGTAAALAAAVPAFAYGGGTSPVANPPVFPGTQTSADAWKLISQGRASGTLVAPRWLLASGHAPDLEGTTVTFTGGRSAKVLKTWTLYGRKFAVPRVAGSQGSDLALSLLEQPVAPPTSGFPLLLIDPVSDELNSVLPGYVQWAGLGGWKTRNEPPTGWTKADGTPPTGGNPIAAIDGDSGSTGFLYRTPTARPVVAAITVHGRARVPFGGVDETLFTDAVTATTSEPATTVKNWLQTQFAKYPEAAPPTFSTFAAAGFNLAALPPAVPGRVRVTGGTGTSVTLGWDAADARIARSGIRVRISPGDRVVTLPATATATTIDGLTKGTEYSLTVKAFNANGESSATPLRPETVRYSPLVVGPVSGLVSAPIRRATVTNGIARADYCVDTNWLPSTAETGVAANRYDVAIDGKVLNPFDGPHDPRISPLWGLPDHRIGVRICDLAADSFHIVTVLARSGLSTGPTSGVGVRTHTGAPLGTQLGAPAGVTVTTRRAATGARADYCFKVTWNAPTAVEGFPVKSYGMSIWVPSEDGNDALFTGVSATDLAPATRSYERCGIRPGFAFRAEVVAQYEPSAARPSASASGATPTGAPVGTALGAPATLAVTASKQLTLFGTANYCAKATWNAPAAVDGFPVLRYGYLLNKGATRVNSASGLSAATRSLMVCGLDPASTYTFLVYAEYDASGSTAQAYTTVTTPAGAPNGTLAPAPTNVTATGVTKTVDGTKAYCANVAWQAPTPIAGFPVASYRVSIDQLDETNAASAINLAPTTRGAQLCGLSAGTAYTATIYAMYDGSLFPRANATPTFSTPA